MNKDGKKVILIIDDDEALQRAFKRALSKLPNVEVLQETDSFQGLSTLQSNVEDIDLVMLDGNLGAGKMSGEELAESITEGTNYCGMLVAMSSDSDMNDKMMHAGCKDQVRKEDALAKIVAFLRLD